MHKNYLNIKNKKKTNHTNIVKFYRNNTTVQVYRYTHPHTDYFTAEWYAEPEEIVLDNSVWSSRCFLFVCFFVKCQLFTIKHEHVYSNTLTYTYIQKDFHRYPSVGSFI